MPKGAVLDTEAFTSVKQLRDMIRRLEIGAATPKGRGLEVLELLKTRDQAEDLMDRFAQEDIDLRPERSRLETIDGVLASKCSLLDRELRSIGGMAGARQQEKPSEDRTWWFSDLVKAEKQRRTLIRTSLIIAGLLLVLIVGNSVLDRLYGLSPLEKEARSFVTTAESSFANGDIDAAIAAYEQALAVDPSMADVQVNLAVLYETKGRTEDAAKALAAGEAASDTRVNYLLNLSQAYAGVGNMDKALLAANEAVAEGPDVARAYLQRGGLYEELGQNSPALDDYDRATSLATEQGEDALYVLARTRYGMLLQRGGGVISPTITITTTPGAE
ncbi:MAG: tetratricopeptide repeat protein [Anaerolineae bacterium]